MSAASAADPAAAAPWVDSASRLGLAFAAGEDPDLAIAADGTLHVVYVRNKDVYYRRQAAGAEPDAEIKLGAGADPAIALGPKGEPHVVVTSDSSGGRAAGSQAALSYSRWDGKTFPPLAVIVSQGGCRKPRIAVGPGGLVIISFEDRRVAEAGGKGVRYLVVAADGTPGRIVEVGTTDLGGLAVDSSGRGHLTWRARRGKAILHASVTSSGEMSPPVTIASPASDFGDITLHPADGSVHVVGEVAAAKGIYYIKCGPDGRWREPQIFAFPEATQVDNADTVNPDIAVDVLGRRFITFTGVGYFPYYFVIDDQDQASPLQRIDPRGGPTGGKFKNPHVTALPGGGACVAWSSDGDVFITRIGAAASIATQVNPAARRP